MQPSTSARQVCALSALPGFGLKLFHRLGNHLGNIDNWAAAPHKQLLGCCANNESLVAVIRKVLTDPAPHLNKQLENWLERDSHRLISYFDADYPASLRQIHLAPALLYAVGDIRQLASPCISVVGSRKATPSYLKLTQEFGFQLARHGWSVVSGMALGIDTEAHKGALAAKGGTIAVLANGLDRCYPKTNQTLMQRIATEGLLISEMPLGTPPKRGFFPRRNRIVSGISKSVLVIEAGLKSGSLITARYALEQNRDVYALPGAPASLNSEGCNWLIREGATLVCTPDQLLTDLGAHSLNTRPPSMPSAHDHQILPTSDAAAVLDTLGGDICSFDDLYEALDVGFETLSNLLLELEIQGRIAATAGGYQRIS